MSSVVLSVRAGQTIRHPGKEPWPPVIEDADKEIVHPEDARLWHREKKNPVRRLVHSPQKVLMRFCAHKTPPLFQATENPRCAVNSFRKRSVCLQQPTKETASFTHLPHHACKEGTDPLVPACQEWITLSSAQEEVLQGFHNLQGNKKVSHEEQPGGTSYQHCTPYPLMQAWQMLKETRLSTNWSERIYFFAVIYFRGKTQGGQSSSVRHGSPVASIYPDPNLSGTRGKGSDLMISTSCLPNKAHIQVQICTLRSCTFTLAPLQPRVRVETLDPQPPHRFCLPLCPAEVLLRSQCPGGTHRHNILLSQHQNKEADHKQAI